MLYRDLDVRIAVSCSPHDTDARGVTRMREVAEEMCRGMSFRCIAILILVKLSAFINLCSILHVVVHTYVASSDYN